MYSRLLQMPHNQAKIFPPKIDVRMNIRLIVHHRHISRHVADFHRFLVGFRGVLLVINNIVCKLSLINCAYARKKAGTNVLFFAIGKELLDNLLAALNKDDVCITLLF